MPNYFNGRGTFGFTCDVCGRELNTCSIVNGMKFCAKCYQETFGKDNQQNEIQQIKQQLEEKDKEIKRVTKIDNKTFLFETYEKPLREQIQLLKQQLVEKQNKIDEMSKEFVQAVHAVYDWRVLCAEKDQRIAELEKDLEFTTKTANELIEIKHKLEQELAELKEKAIVPKFKGSSIVYSIAFKEIEKVQVIAYLNRCIILCRNLKTRELHTIHCDYLFETEQEAQAKLKEMNRNG